MMLDITLLIIAGVCCVLGLVGSFLPVLPGPLTSWVGLAIFYNTSFMQWDWVFLGITLVISTIVWLLDYVISAVGTKRFGGTRYGIIGTTIGLIVGILFLGPFGILIGPFFGAFLGEMMNPKQNVQNALKAALGSLIGFLSGVFIKFSVSVIFLIIFVVKVFENWNSI
ncbi:hypothetical protein BD809_101375 [Aquimarina intermedia]|uniref:DUF456 domain-containing protein n=2 Tax=Aquimarina intermedia TaxID=350814 RepID=A0A5S5CCY7_9FLAO|nr:hypothetical protein BD809_101375 [Aquimarina intermedia]